MKRSTPKNISETLNQYIKQLAKASKKESFFIIPVITLFLHNGRGIEMGSRMLGDSSSILHFRNNCFLDRDNAIFLNLRVRNIGIMYPTVLRGTLAVLKQIAV